MREPRIHWNGGVYTIRVQEQIEGGWVRRNASSILPNDVLHAVMHQLKQTDRW